MNRNNPAATPKSRALLLFDNHVLWRRLAAAEWSSLWIPKVVKSKVQKAQAKRREPSLPSLFTILWQTEGGQLVYISRWTSVLCRRKAKLSLFCHPSHPSAERVFPHFVHLPVFSRQLPSLAPELLEHLADPAVCSLRTKNPTTKPRFCPAFVFISQPSRDQGGKEEGGVPLPLSITTHYL